MPYLDNQGVETLVSEIKSKADDAYQEKLVSGTNIKTVNNTSLLGSGNVSITVPTASTSTPLMDGTASYGSGTTYARGNHRHPTDTSRQATLVSGTNIKTINGQSILGSGNLTISGGSGGDSWEELPPEEVFPDISDADSSSLSVYTNGALLYITCGDSVSLNGLDFGNAYDPRPGVGVGFSKSGEIILIVKDDYALGLYAYSPSGDVVLGATFTILLALR